MQLFNLINGWAGRNDLLDAALRFFYVSAVPLLATLLAAVLIFRPRAPHTPSRLKIAAASLLSIAGCAAVMALVNAFALYVLNVEILSPRPFVTHYVTLLIVEPNDNSFPAPEVMLASALAVCLWAAWARFALPAFLFTLLFAFSRIFCGSNYPVDTGVGMLWGATIGALCLACCGIPLAWAGKREMFVWRTGKQAGASVTVFAGALLFALFTISNIGSYGVKMREFLYAPVGSSAHADGSGPRTPARLGKERFAGAPGVPVRTAEEAAPEGKVEDGTPTEHASLPDSGAREGEGVPGLNLERDTPTPGVTALGGHLPAAEASLERVLKGLKLPHRLVSIDVAELNDRTWHYRAAAVRIEVRREGAAERKAVTTSAARIVKEALRSDGRLQNIDVTAVVLNEPRRTGPSAASGYVFTVGAVPVFNCSVQRRNLVLKKGPQWLNAPGVDAGSWLRARSRLYINSRVLPAVDIVEPTPTPTPVPTASPTPLPTPSPTAAPTATPSPSATPARTATPAPAPTPARTPARIPTVPVSPHVLPHVAPTARATVRPTAKPAPRPTPRPTARPTPKPAARPVPRPAPRPRPRVTRRPVPTRPLSQRPSNRRVPERRATTRRTTERRRTHSYPQRSRREYRSRRRYNRSSSWSSNRSSRRTRTIRSSGSGTRWRIQHDGSGNRTKVYY